MSEERIAKLEREVEKLRMFAAKTEYCLNSGCIRCSGQCALDEHVWQTFLKDEAPPVEGKSGDAE